MPLHSHNGDEHLVVIRGGPMTTSDGKIIDMPTGATFDFPRGIVHGGLTVTGEVSMPLYTVHIVEKDAPLNVAPK